MEERIIHLVVQEGPDAGMEISVAIKGSRLGRSKHNEIRLSDGRLSRHHCRLYFRDDRLFIQDLESANQTLVNDRVVQDIRITTGDCITVGNTKLKVLHDGEKEALRIRPPKPAASPDGAAPKRDVRERVDEVLGHDERPLSVAIRAPLWLLMIAWWCFLAYSLLMPRLPTEDSVGADDWAAAAGTGDGTPELPMAQQLENLGVTADQLSHMGTLKQIVVDCMLDDNYQKALLLTKTAANFQADEAGRNATVELGRFVHEVSQIDTLVAQAFASNIGRKVQLLNGNRRIAFVPKAVAGHQISGKQITPTGEKLVTFKVSSVQPSERNRWIGEARTPAKSAMKCVLHMQAGDFASARVYAANAGPLTEALTTKSNDGRDS